MSTAEDLELKPLTTLNNVRLQPAQRKRKKPHVEQLPLLFDAFKIHSSNNTALTIEPLRTVAKSAIPLHIFDFVPCDSKDGHNGLFHVCNPTLEGSIQGHAQDQAHILLVQVNHTARLAAIEWIDQDVYSITFLRLGVDVEALDTRIKQVCPRPRKFQRTEPRQDAQQQWWHRAALRNNSISDTKADQVNPANGRTVELDSETQPVPQTEEGENSKLDDHTDAANPQHYQPIESVAISLAEQYLDALYLSRTSLAYFPKSTLSRARAAAGSVQTDPSRVQSFTAVLRAMVLSPSTFDKKYRQSIPTAIKELSASHLGSGADLDASKERRKKVKKLKKPKPGKNGLYSIETDFVKKWWHDDEVTPEQASGPDHVKAKQTELRFREILLQILLVLETIALESSLQAAPKLQSSTALGSLNIDSQDVDSQGVDSQNKSHDSKGEKVQNLDAILEMLVDRLCIWQSIEAADVDDKNKDVTAHDETNPNPQTAPASKDKLQDFCHHVLIPFYGPRLRLKVEELAKRMGVSVQASPARPPLVKSSTMVPPGTEIRRKPPGAARRQLQRTKSSTGMQRKPPSLMRSATDSQLRVETRESSSTPFEEPMKPPRRTLSRASSISSSTKLSQREVDMTAIAKFSQSRRKPSVDTELRDAITTLKKPNRERAVEDYVNSVDSKKMPFAKKPWLKSRLNVEVGATPRREQKTKNVLRQAPEAESVMTGFEDDFPIPSTKPDAAASPPRVAKTRDRASSPVGGRLRPLLPNVDVFETPSKRTSKSRGHESMHQCGAPVDTVPASASKTLSTAPIQGTPIMAFQRAVDLVPQSSPPQKSHDDQQLHPTSPRDHSPLQEGVVNRLTKPPIAGPGTSIYESLGWDDDNDVDDLQ